MSENEVRQERSVRPAGKKHNRTGSASSGNVRKKRRPASGVQKDTKSNVQEQVAADGQKKQNPKRKKQNNNSAANQKKNTAQTVQSRRSAGANQNVKSGGAQRNNRNRQGRGGPPKIHDGFDDIRSYGGRYLKLPDYDEMENATLSSAGLISATVSESAAENEPISLSDEQAPVAGRNAVHELLRSGRSIDKIFVKSGQREGSLVAIVAQARNQHIPISEVAQEKLDQLAKGANHQGVVAVAAEKDYTDIDGILNIAADRGEMPLVVIADSIEDPHNLGALIRCAECAGAHGVIIPKRRSAGLTPVVSKASAGALEHMAIAKVPNIAQAVTELKEKGLWVFVSEADGSPYYETDFCVPAAIVLGSEGAGVSKTVRDKSDFTVSIPMYGKINSLNVSTAASVILCHAARMQHGK